MRAVRWIALACGVSLALGTGCDDPKPKVEKPDEANAPAATNGSATNGSATNGAVETNGAVAAGTLEVEASYLTMKLGDEPEVRHDFIVGERVKWLWTADANRNMVYYHSGLEGPGDFISISLNMNEPGEKLTLGRYGNGKQAELSLAFNGKLEKNNGTRDVQARSGWVEAKRDPVTGAMVGSFEGEFLHEPRFKPLVTGPEHEGKLVKMSGTFAIQPPPREEGSGAPVPPVAPSAP